MEAIESITSDWIYFFCVLFKRKRCVPVGNREKLNLLTPGVVTLLKVFINLYLPRKEFYELVCRCQ